MITNYPFSVILDVPNNPYLTSGGAQYLPYTQENSGEAIMNSLEDAALRVYAIYQQQKNAYDDFNNYLQLNGSNITLEDIFKKQYNLFDKTDTIPEVETEKIIDAQEEYVEALKKKQAEFHANYLAAIDRIAQATTIKELEACKIKVKKNAEEIDKLLQQALSHFKDFKLTKKIKNAKQTQGSDINIKIKKDGINISFQKTKTKTNSSERNKQNQRAETAISNYYEILQEIVNYEKKHGITLGAKFAQSSKFKHEHQEIFDRYVEARKELEGALTGFYSRENRRALTRFIKEIIFGEAQEKELYMRSSKHGDYLVQAASFAFEQTSIEQIGNEIVKALKDEAKVRTFTMDVPVRVQFQALPLASEKEEAHTELYALQNTIDVKLDKFFRSWKVLDKVDDYVSVKFSEGNSYVLAFSNKLYHDLSRLNIVGNSKNSLVTDEAEELNSHGTNLINSYDLIAQAGQVADAFMFTVLNRSTASGLHDSIDQVSLESWLNSFIYEMAFNPKSFIQNLENSVKEEITDKNIIYFFNAGSTIQPVYKILYNIYNFLLSTSFNLQSCITTKIQYDNSVGTELLEEVDQIYPPVEGKGKSSVNSKKYPPEAWNWVANQVASNTLISVHLDLLKLMEFDFTI